MPSLVDLQEIPDSDCIDWEAIIVNRASDTDLLNLENKALLLALESRSAGKEHEDGTLARSLAILVAEHMGGAVKDTVVISQEWKDLRNRLRLSLGNTILPLGLLMTGLARHRALMFKVLSDSVGLPCQLLKGQYYTGSDDGTVNIVKMNNGREYIVDLMADPGTLIPSDAVITRGDGEIGLSPSSSSYAVVDSMSEPPGCLEEHEKLKRRLTVAAKMETGNQIEQPERKETSKSLHDKNSAQAQHSSDAFSNLKASSHKTTPKQNHTYSLARSPSWTEGISSTTVRRMKAKDVSQYMIDAAKENPQLAQKLHDVLLESGVVAPPSLFAEICPLQSDSTASDVMSSSDMQELSVTGKDEKRQQSQSVYNNGQLNPSKVFPRLHVDHLEPVEGLGVPRPLDLSVVCPSPQSETTAELTSSPVILIKKMPVAAAAATAAVVASSMVVAVAKSSTDNPLEVPMAAAATATAAVVAATTAAVSKQYEPFNLVCGSPISSIQKSGEEDGTPRKEYDAGFDHGSHTAESYHEAERNSDRSTGNESTKSDFALDDVAEFEILWEDLTVGERIGLGSYGEVFHGVLHGTEVAIKKFLQQDLSGDALDEFRTEVQIMKRLRHPNVVLFMGAVTRVPNLSIVTEFLPRGSLFRLIHRPNNQLDERRRLKMALDVARGMNYLHNCSPMIVHGDLKSPNLLVDKNWVVKVCDFGLSRIKHSTFLSSRSMAGTAEWMAPEVLRNEPSDEKCDVYSFGVILWELCTLQLPWGGMNPMQVVGAVGFQSRKLDIPEDLNPAIADIIINCWQTDPKLRPSFSEIMAALKPLQKKALTNTQTVQGRQQRATP
ncbi:putative serine/threonine-protein kinase SIS8 isoform X2 [Wolffia australiana]